ncbi:MAG: ISAs1 family transposase [Deltaproteobacteria bacterium]|nr:ISAs1 family transposase [Deltaproteobacteria bacterium]
MPETVLCTSIMEHFSTLPDPRILLKTGHKLVDIVSSLPSDAKRFAEAARGHWAVENSLHWCLDIAFREDDSRVRSGHAQENLGTIRRLALNLIKQDSQQKIGVKASRKRAGWDMDYIKKLLGIA